VVKGHRGDELIAKVHRAQADALEIEATAKRRLADEYDVAQERGERFPNVSPAAATIQTQRHRYLVLGARSSFGRFCHALL